MTNIFQNLRLRAVAICAVAFVAMLAWHPWTSTAHASTVSDTKVIIQKIGYSKSEPSKGAKVSVSKKAQRVFANSNDGFAVVSVKGQLTPARTTDGGEVWRIDGPGVFTEGAADAPLTVENIGLRNASTFYIYGGGQVVDITSDGGKYWRRVIFQGLEAGVSPVDHGIAAYVDQSNSTGNSGNTLQFVTHNGGRSWKLVKGYNF